MKIRSYFGVCLLLCPLLAFSEQYLCVPDKATGFTFDARTKTWDYATFNTDFRYIVASAKGGMFPFTLTKVGDKDPQGFCKNGFNEGGVLFCDIYGGEFKFNRNNGRYLLAFTFGYYNVGKGLLAETDVDSGTPMIQIGKCSPF